MRVKLIQLDGALPNLALMKLAHWHRAHDDDVLVTRRIEPDLFEERSTRVYGPAIFRFSSLQRDGRTRHSSRGRTICSPRSLAVRRSRASVMDARLDPSDQT